MTRVGYWVDLFQAQRHLGAGFLLTRRFVLTALHCLHALDALDDQVDIALADERRVPGRVCGKVKEADLALIEIAASHEVALQVPTAQVALRGDRWWGPYRPAPGEAQLSGGIEHGAVRHTCEGGGSIEALQLTADQHLGDYSGYSGGPVEGGSPEGAPVVLGILLEQALDRQSAGHRAANVLFAATIAEAMRRFDHFDVGHLIDALRPPAESRAVAPEPSPPPLGPPPGPPQSRLERQDVAESLLHNLRRWSEQGLIDPAQFAQARLRVLRRVIDGELGIDGEPGADGRGADD